jgi:hypothetical protein
MPGYTHVELDEVHTPSRYIALLSFVPWRPVVHLLALLCFFLLLSCFEPKSCLFFFVPLQILYLFRQSSVRLPGRDVNVSGHGRYADDAIRRTFYPRMPVSCHGL